LWSEWNGRYRDSVRDFWRGQEQGLGEFAARLTGSSDLYEATGRRPSASINFVTAHDGFTLADLVAYNEKHNEANGEEGRDGTDDNRSWNCGVEGPTDDPDVRALRRRQQRKPHRRPSEPRFSARSMREMLPISRRSSRQTLTHSHRSTTPRAPDSTRAELSSGGERRSSRTSVTSFPRSALFE